MRGRGRWPLLERALEDESRAYSSKIEWLVDLPAEEGVVRRKAEFNYTEIFREWSTEGLLSQIEYALKNGRRELITSRSEPVGYMGGAYELLGRLPEEGDRFSLRILNDLTYYPSPRGEWLAEVSLLAA